MLFTDCRIEWRIITWLFLCALSYENDSIYEFPAWGDLPSTIKLKNSKRSSGVKEGSTTHLLKSFLACHGRRLLLPSSLDISCGMGFEIFQVLKSAPLRHLYSMDQYGGSKYAGRNWYITHSQILVRATSIAGAALIMYDTRLLFI